MLYVFTNKSVGNKGLAFIRQFHRGQAWLTLSILLAGLQFGSSAAYATAYGPGGTTCQTSGTASGPDNIDHGKLANPVNGSGTWSNVIGCGANGAGYDGVQIMGAHAAANGAGAVAVGFYAVAGLRSAAYGMASQASGTSATALGQWAQATGNGSVALGGNNSSNTAASGAQASAANAIAVGGQSRSAGSGSVAIGVQAQAQAARGIALGSGANAANADDVALGSGAQTAAAVGTSSVTIRGVNYNFAGTSPIATVSVGVAGSERTITNLAAGQLSSSSTDAVNGSQLYATNQAIEALNTEASAGWNLTAQGANSSNVAPGAAVDLNNNDNNVVLSKSTDSNNVTFDLAKDLQLDSVTTGNSRLDTNGLAITGGPSVTASGIDMGGTKISQVANATESGDVVNLGQLNDSLAANKTRYYSVNDNGTQGDNYANDGATGVNALAAGVGASASIDNGVALGSGSVSNRAIATSSGMLNSSSAQIPYNTTDQTLLGAVSVGSDTSYRQIINVADGTQDQDAVTVRQLTAGLSSVSVSGGRYFHANSSADDSLSVGSESIAIGPRTVVNGDNGIGMGNHAVVEQNAPGGIAVGDEAHAELADAIALGTQADASGEQSLAFGAGSQASQAGAVALGAGSQTEAAVATASATIGGTTYAFAGTNPTSTVSVGAAGKERTITHMAAGQLSSSSTDAVNGSQLYATNQAVESANATANAGWNLSAQGANSNKIAPGGTVDLRNGDGNLVLSKSADSNDVTFDLAKDLQLDSVTMGNTRLDTNGLVLAGGPSVTASGIDMGGTKITHVAAGTAATDAVNVSQLSGAIAASQTHYYSVNDRGVQGGNYANDGATGANAMAAGVGASASADNSVALGAGSQASQDGSVALGAGSQTEKAVATADTTINGTTYQFAGASPTSTVSVGAEGQERTITHVAAGRIDANSTDAINGSQLHATNQAVEAVAQVQQETNGSVTHLQNQVTGNTSAITDLNQGRAGMVQVSPDQAGTAPAATGQNSLAAGANASASGNTSLAVGNQAKATADNSVALGNNSLADRANSVSVGGPDNLRQITHVAAGTQATDAATVGQVQGAQDWAKNYTDSQINDLASGTARRFNRMDRRLQGLCAMSAASTQMAMVGAGASDNGRVAVGVGVCARSSGALAIGYANSVGDRGHVSIGGAFTSSQKQFGVGFGWDL